MGAALVRLGVTADLLTVSGIVISIVCAFAIANGYLLAGCGLLILSGLPDLLDGPVAKASGTQSIRGAFFDSVSDRITDSIVLGGITWYLATTSGGTIVLIPVALLAVSQLISYERAKAEIYGFDAKGGLMERAERIIALGIGLAFSALLVPILVLTLALTSITAVQRFAKVWRQATDDNPVLAARRRETPPLMRNFLQTWTESDETRRRSVREWAAKQRKARRSARNE